MKDFLLRNIKLIVAFGFTLIVHLLILFFYKFNLTEKAIEISQQAYRATNIVEFIPQKQENKESLEVPKQEKTTEEVIETEKEIKEVESEYLLQHQITEIPILPESIIKNKIVYPILANKQGIEGVVYLELYIDKNGIIKNIVVLKDPGYGFAEAAVKALEGIKCIPAKVQGVPVAVRYRYSVRFVLKR